MQPSAVLSLSWVLQDAISEAWKTDHQHLFPSFQVEYVPNWLLLSIGYFEEQSIIHVPNTARLY